jgi:hypothetical protein
MPVLDLLYVALTVGFFIAAISPAAASFQAERVAAARGIPAAEVNQLIAEHIEDRTFGLLGERRVNVLLLNLALDEKAPRPEGDGIAGN